MRIDLMSTGRRPWVIGIVLRVVKAIVGIAPGPPLMLSYRPDLLGSAFRRHFLRPSSRRNPWEAGELELMGTLVSHLNACTY